MNSLHVTLLFLAGIYLVLRLVARDRDVAGGYLRYVLLGMAAFVVLAPFLWLICSAFKGKDVLMAHTFLPPVSEWSAKTINLGNFRALFGGEESL